MRFASLLAAVGMIASSSAAFAGNPIPGCSGCSYAYSEAGGSSGQLGEVAGAYKYQERETEGGYGDTSALTSVFGTSPKGFTFESAASGSLRTGALHASASQAGGYADAFVELKDMVMFQFDPALVAAGVTHLTGTLTWTVEGVQQEVDGQSYAGPDGNTQISLLTSSWLGTQINISDFKWSDHPIQDGQANLPFEGPGAYKVTYSRDFTILSGVVYNLDAILSVSAGGGFGGYDPEGHQLATTAPSSADYGNTSFFNFVLPDGVKLLSGSGELLDAPYNPGGTSSAAPEPATWSMLLIGFGAIGVSIRRRSARTAFS